MLEQRNRLAQEAVCLLGGQFDRGRRRLLERGPQVGPQRQRVTEPAEQTLLRVLEQSAERLQALAVRPHLRGRHQHARVLLMLEQKLDSPGVGVDDAPRVGVERGEGHRVRALWSGAVALVCGGADAVFVLVAPTRLVPLGPSHMAALTIVLVAGGHEPEARPEHAPCRVCLASGPPLFQLFGKPRELPRVTVDRWILVDKRQEPTLEHPADGSISLAHAFEPASQQPARAGVDGRVEKSADNRVGTVPLLPWRQLGTEQRWHRADQQLDPGIVSDVVGHRPPSTYQRSPRRSSAGYSRPRATSSSANLDASAR